jgi:hypothetical protein
MGGTQNPEKLLGYVLLCLRLAELSVAGARAGEPKRGQEFKNLLDFMACEDCPELGAWLQQRRCELLRGPAAASCTCGRCGQQARGDTQPQERAAAAASAEQAGVSSTSGS